MIECPAEQIDTNKSLLDYGVDSIRLIELSGILEEHFNFSIEPALLYEMPSIESLLKKLNQKEQQIDTFTPQKSNLPIHLIISASFTSEPVDEGLHFIFKAMNYTPTIQFTPYNQVLQELLNPNSFFNQFNQGPRTILIRF